MTADDNRHYDADDITVLEGLEAVRKRPGMYIGSTSERGLHHLVYEIVDNAVDEALAGFNDTIHVTILADGGVRVEDRGRGIPVAMHSTEKVPTLQVVLTILHAGGKFGGGGYAVSGGLHGVGSSVVNALSKKMDAEVHRDGYVWRQSYERGVPTGDVTKGEVADHTGTIITFWPDEEIFDTVQFNFETLRARFQQMAFLNKGLSITLRDERAEQVNDDDVQLEEQEEEFKPREVTFKYDNGLFDYVQYLNSTKKSEPVHEDIISFEAEDTEETIALEVAMQWTSSYAESVHTYANTTTSATGWSPTPCKPKRLYARPFKHPKHGWPPVRHVKRRAGSRCWNLRVCPESSRTASRRTRRFRKCFWWRVTPLVVRRCRVVTR